MDKLTIIKAGGKLIDSAAGQEQLLAQFLKVPGKKMLVHGGGTLITQLCDQLGVQTQMLNGRRVTSKENLDVVLMACAGKLNKELVSKLIKSGNLAIGLTGADLNLLESKKRDPNPVNFGHVGDIQSVNTGWLKVFLDKNVVPVIASLSHSVTDGLLNTNADSIASSLVKALSVDYKVNLYYMMDKPGVLSDVESENSMIHHLTYRSYELMKQEKMIHNGMIPKLDQGFLALRQGAAEVQVGNQIYKGTVLSLD